MLARRPPGMALLRIKKWTPAHTLVVVDMVGGMSISEAAEKHGYSYSWVSCLMKTPEAIAMVQKLQDNIIKRAGESLGERLKMLQLNSLSKVEEFIRDDFNLSQAMPMQYFDRAMRVAQATGVIGSERAPSIVVNDNSIHNSQTNNITQEQADNLLAAFSKANEVESKFLEIPANVNG